MLRTNERLAKFISYKMIKGLYSNYVNNCVIIHLNITQCIHTCIQCICNNNINCMP